MEEWKKFENIEVSNLGHLKTRKFKDCNYTGSTNSDGYNQVRVGKKLYTVHRLVCHLFLNIEYSDPRQVDHINGLRSDNRLENLRMVTPRQNSQNSLYHRNGGLIGTSYEKRRDRWVSYITLNGKQKFLGYFDTELEAHDAYLNALNELK